MRGLWGRRWFAVLVLLSSQFREWPVPLAGSKRRSFAHQWRSVWKEFAIAAAQKPNKHGRFGLEFAWLRIASRAVARPLQSVQVIRMDIARPDLKRRRNRMRMVYGTVVLGIVALLTLGLASLGPAMPPVDSAQIWTGKVERGEMLRQVRGNGTLVPKQIQLVQSDTDGRVEKIHLLPGAAVESSSVILELSNPELVQQAFELKWQLHSAEAQLKQLVVKQQSDRLTQESAIATLKASLTQAELEAEADAVLAADGLVPELTRKRSRANAEELSQRLDVERRRLDIMSLSDEAELAVQEAELEKLRASLQLTNEKVNRLTVRAGIAGVLQSVGDDVDLQVGRRIGPGSTLARIVQPQNLKAEIRIAETQARDVQIGQIAEIDTRNGVISGRVSRVDPAVENGTVTVDVTLEGALPRGARPDLSVDGTIQLERLTNVLHVGRPVHGQPDSNIGLFKVVDGIALRVPVQLGRSSVNRIEVREGLSEGDQVVLSDMSQYDEFDRIKLD